jgi:formate dehydrogenase subunit delta
VTPETIRMKANQIAGFFRTQGEAEAVAGTLDHIRKFWDPRMRADLVKLAEAGGEGLDPVALAAARELAG